MKGVEVMKDENEQTGLLRQLRIRSFKWDSKTEPFSVLRGLYFSSRGGFACATTKYRKEVPQGNETKGKSF